MSRPGRRKLLKGVATIVPAVWATPIIKTVILPAHAQTSVDNESNEDPCSGSPGFETFSISVSCDPLENERLSFGIDDSGDCPRWVTGTEASDTYSDPVPNAEVRGLDRTPNELEAVWRIGSSFIQVFNYECGEDGTEDRYTLEFATSTGAGRWEAHFLVEFTSTSITSTLESVNPV